MVALPPSSSHQARSQLRPACVTNCLRQGMASAAAGMEWCAAASAREAGGRSCARVKLSHAPGRRVAFFNLEEYESAKAAFEAAHALEARRETATWIRKCDAELHGAAPQQPFLHAACLQEALGAPPLSELPSKAPCVTGLPPTRSYPALRTCWQ